MKAYKIFRVIDGELYSSMARGKALIHYRPGKKSKGKVFSVISQQRKIRNPIFAFQTMKDALAFLGFCSQDLFELWEVEGIPWRKKFIGWSYWDTIHEKGYVYNLEQVSNLKHFSYAPRGIICLQTCTPIRKVKVGRR